MPDDDELSISLAKLTSLQANRLAANIAGETSTEIARREGVTPQAVDESIQRAELVLAGHTFFAKTRDNGEERSIVEALLTNLVRIATSAQRPVIYGNKCEMVPDNALRLTATLRLLDMVAPAAAPVEHPVNSGGVSETVDESVEATRTSTTLKVQRRRRA